jgi:hypothetical protein
VWLGLGMEPLEGSCGSVILDEEGYTVCFFRFLADRYPGCRFATAVDTLLKLDYHLA